MKALGWIVALSVTAAAFGADTTHKGYLADGACAGVSKAMDGADMKHSPGNHTVACMVMCSKNGYGIMVKKGATYKFVPFKGKGNDLAASVLKGTTKTKDLSVEVTGIMKGGAIDVTDLKESNM